MAKPNRDAPKPDPTQEAEVVTTKVNVAFPFSRITVQEPSEELAALATLVRDMADVLVDVTPGSKARELSKRAKALTARLA